MILDMKDVSWPGWETVKILGHGSYGAVYEIQRDVFGDLEKAALKVISIPQNDSEISELVSDGYSREDITQTYQKYLQNIVSEYSIMRKLNGSTNVVHCDDVRYEQQPNGIGWHIYIKMELLTPMSNAIPPELSDEFVIQVAKDMCAALNLCAKHNIIHRDIKPQNMFFSENGDCKLGDFGIAKTVSATTRGTIAGTPRYMAPEVYKGQPYGVSSDLYSLGLVLYWLLNERRTPFIPLPPAPFSAGMDGEANNRRLLGEPFPSPKNGSDRLKQIVMKACAYDPKDRYPSAAAMLQDLKDLESSLFIPVPSRMPPEIPKSADLTNTYTVRSAPKNESSQTPSLDLSDSRDTAAPAKAEVASAASVYTDQKAAVPERDDDDVYSQEYETERKSKLSFLPILFTLLAGVLLLLVLWGMKGFPGFPRTDSAGAKSNTGIHSVSVSGTTQPSGSDLNQDTACITFQAQGGNGADTPMYVDVQQAIGTLPTPTRPHYDFVGWYDQVEGGRKFSGDSVISENLTLYAQWKPKTFTVTFQANGGTTSTSQKTVTYGNTYGSLPTAERKNYTFVGWYTQLEGGTKIVDNTIADRSDNLTLYAQWSQNTYTVFFYPGDGKVSVTDMNAVSGAPIGTLPTPTREHYDFSGWYTSSDAGQLITSDTVLNRQEALSVYAHWEPKRFSVSFDATGGSVNVKNKYIAYDESFGALPTPTRDYYEFSGWYTAKSGGSKVTESTIANQSEDMTLYARWTEKSLSGWVKASNVPSGAQVVNRKWSYTKTTTKESTSTSLSGYSQVDSYWVQSGSDSTNYATFPNTFDTSHSLYKNFAKSAYSGYENATSKRVVTNSWAGYIYWHWMYNVSYSNTTTRFISDRTGSFDKYGKTNSNSYYFGWFYAFTSSVNCSYLDNNYCCNRNQPSYYCHNILPSDKSKVGTPRFFRFDYYTSTYTDYYKMFVYEKTENLESYSKVTPSGDISNVQEWVQYRPK